MKGDRGVRLLLVLFCLLIGLFGLALLLDLRGISSKARVGILEWWSRGPVRRRLRKGVMADARPFGVLLILVALIAILEIIFNRIR